MTHPSFKRRWDDAYKKSQQPWECLILSQEKRNTILYHKRKETSYAKEIFSAEIDLCGPFSQICRYSISTIRIVSKIFLELIL